MFQRSAPPSRFMHAKRTSTHFATTENLPNPVTSVGRVLASHVFLGTLERIYLNDELWRKKGVCVERVSGLDVTVVGAGAEVIASKVQVWAKPVPGRPQKPGV